MSCAQGLTRHACAVAAAVVAAVAAAPHAYAHPHSWIDLNSTVVLTGEGKITAVRARWAFDEYYTADLMRQTGGVQVFADTALTNLRPYGYFTHLNDAGGRADFASPSGVAARLEGKRLVLEFTLPLARPVGPNAELRVFDPTYYIDMAHRGENAVTVEGAGAARCRTRIVEAQPSEETRRRAFEMDRQAVPDHGLGEQFAQTVILQCG